MLTYTGVNPEVMRERESGKKKVESKKELVRVLIVAWKK